MAPEKSIIVRRDTTRAAPSHLVIFSVLAMELY